jgi:hypothetical protein
MPRRRRAMRIEKALLLLTTAAVLVGATPAFADFYIIREGATARA